MLEQIKQKMKSSPKTLPQHLQQPHISLDTYLRVQRQEIGQRAMSRRRIYLDQRFWIECRDAEIGGPKVISSSKEIWRLLKLAVESGRVWCPAFASVYSETMKQTSDLRCATAHVIDRLSGGIAIRHSEQRVMIEFSHWVWTTLLGDQSITHPHAYVWTPLSSILGEAIPCETNFSQDTELAIQKSWLDLIRNFSLEDFFSILNEHDILPSRENDAAFQQFQTIMSRVHRNDHKTFDDVFKIELRGIFDLIQGKIFAFAEDLYTKEKFVALDDQPPSDSQELALNLIALAIIGLEQGRVDTGLPFLHISASIHATIRHIGQPYKKGDTHDFQHAAAALPYCEAFFTDKAMANLLKREPVHLDKVYRCKVLNKRDDVIDYLKTIND